MPDDTPRIDEVATSFLRYLDDRMTVPLRDPNFDGGAIYAINPDAELDLASGIQDLIANIISELLNAGSERDAVNEDDELYAAIRSQLRGWMQR